MFFLFPLAFFSLLVRNPPFGFPFLLNLLPLSDVLGRFGLQLFLLALGGSDASFLFLCSTRSRLLVLVIAFFGLLFFAFLDPTLGRLGNPIGLFGPLFAHHVSHRDLFATGHCCLDTLLACHEHARVRVRVVDTRALVVFPPVVSPWLCGVCALAPLLLLVLRSAPPFALPLPLPA